MRPVLANLLLSASSVACGLLLCELGTRLLADVGPSLIVKDPLVGKRYVPGFRGAVYVPEAGRRVELRFQRDGFRGEERPYEKPPDVRRIALLGDSMIVAVATDEDKTLARQLEGILNAPSPSKRWEVLNFGISSASTGEELVLDEQVAERYHPDLVVCAFFVGNDLADNSPRLTHAPRLYFDLDGSGQLRLLPFDASTNPASEWLNRHSRFYVWQKVAVSRLRDRFRSAAGGSDPTLLVFLDQEHETPDVAHAWALTDKIIQEFKREVEAHGVRFVLVMLPSAEEIYDDLWQDLLRRAPAGGLGFRRDNPELRMAALCRNAGVPLVTMVDAFRRAAPAASSRARAEWLFCLGRYHFNDAGNLLAAKVIAESLGSLALP